MSEEIKQAVEEPPQVECESCGDSIVEGDAFDFHGEVLCQGCWDDKTFECERCDERALREQSCEVEGDTVCESCAEESASCEDCGNAFWTDNLQEHHGNMYCNRCYEEQGSSLREFSGRRELKGAGRGIGVEIEVSEQDQADHEDAEEDYKWTAVEDGSVEDGIEYNSPILHESNYEEEVKQFCTTRLKQARVDCSCGLHVHLDCSDVGWLELANVFRYCKRYERYFFSLMPKSRQNNSYCQQMPHMRPPHTKADMIGYLYGRSKVSQMKRSKYPDVQGNGCINRYFWMNVHSYFYRRTIEFRLHNGTTNHVKVINWIKLLLLVLANARGPEKDWKHPEELLSQELRAYFDERIEEFGKE